MSDRSAIEWTDASWNPVRAKRLLADGTVLLGWHCVHKSPGCARCYAEGFNKRLGTKLAYKPGHERDIEIYLDDKMLLLPLKWQRPRKIFVGSMTDLFADFVTDEMLDRIFAVMALCPQHIFQVLTKRADRMRAYFADPDERAMMIGIAAGNMLDGDWIWNEGKPFRKAIELIIDRSLGYSDDPKINQLDDLLPLPNVWLGVSVEDQVRADERIPDLLATPAAVRFLSCEPLLGPVDLSTIDVSGHEEIAPLGWRWLDRLDDGAPEWPRIDWVICGGESGPDARPMHPDWARSLRDQCAAAGAPFFFKQWGAWTPGENVERRTGWVAGAHWFDDDWMFEDQDLAADDGHIDDEPDLYRVGKKAAGRHLDGVEHDGMPA